LENWLQPQHGAATVRFDGQPARADQALTDDAIDEWPLGAYVGLTIKIDVAVIAALPSNRES
jgi:hypothetical protein